MNPQKRKSKTRRPKPAETPLPESLRRVNLHAAGIDIGATEHWVAVPPGSDPKPVRAFGSFTADLHALADWLKACGVTTEVAVYGTSGGR
jgi:hypothetical protein